MRHGATSSKSTTGPLIGFKKALHADPVLVQYRFDGLLAQLVRDLEQRTSDAQGTGVHRELVVIPTTPLRCACAMPRHAFLIRLQTIVAHVLHPGIRLQFRAGLRPSAVEAGNIVPLRKAPPQNFSDHFTGPWSHKK